MKFIRHNPEYLESEAVRSGIRFCLAALALMATLLSAAPAGAIHADHALNVELFPDEHRLSGDDQIRVKPEGAERLAFRLSEAARVTGVSINGEPRPANRFQGFTTVNLEPDERNGDISVELQYEAVFDDPVPRIPANTDNPGYGVHATIRPEGTLLLGGAGWYPGVTSARENYRIRVSAPEGVFAVTSGRSLGTRTENGRSISEWDIRNPAEMLALAASKYRINKVEHGNVTLYTYFTEKTVSLSPAYLNASARYISMYENLFGPYPFDKFAVVENFFPTGYGFPSYTLIGGRVLQLPFILETSLGHEIAHCWWGNGVQVDFESGNWSEGLTSYVAEHYYQELKSPDAAREHRRNYLRNYATLVNEESDFPLARFRSRVDAVTRTIGYDKGAMVFHMLRIELGEAAFWGALRDIYRDYLFAAASWRDFQKAFEARSGRNLNDFFNEWVYRKGALNLKLTDLERGKTGERWRLSGTIRQKQLFFAPGVTVGIRDKNKRDRHRLSLSGPETTFEFYTLGPPAEIEVDPDIDLFRRLHPEEIPPSINGLKGAENVTIVLSADGEGLKPTADMLIRAMPLRNAKIIEEIEISEDLLNTRHLIVVGHPRSPAVDALVRGRIKPQPEGVGLLGMPKVAEADTFFGVYAHPKTDDRLMAIFASTTTTADSVTVARKIPHYGRYSYLAFSGAINRAKGVWMVQNSPLIHRWEPKLRQHDNGRIE